MVSVVVPLYNEEHSVETLYGEITAALEPSGEPHEVIFVDDGSTDGSLGVLTGLHAETTNVVVVHLRRNFGKAVALQAGFLEARGDIVVTIDADLQDDPAEIPQLLAKLGEGFDLVSGWKSRRNDPWTRRLLSRVFNWATAVVSGVRLHDVIRDHLVRDHRATVRDWSVTLLAVLRGRCAHGEWHRISDDTADDLDQLAFLLVSTGHDDELRELLFDLRFLVRRMRQGGVAGLSADLAVCQSAAARDPWLAALGRIVDLEGHLAMRVEDPASTAATLYSRLAGDPAVRDLLTHRDAALTDSLAVSHPLPDRPDSRLCRVIRPCCQIRVHAALVKILCRCVVRVLSGGFPVSQAS